MLAQSCQGQNKSVKRVYYFFDGTLIGFLMIPCIKTLRVEHVQPLHGKGVFVGKNLFKGKHTFPKRYYPTETPTSRQESLATAPEG